MMAALIAHGSAPLCRQAGDLALDHEQHVNLRGYYACDQRLLQPREFE